MTSLIRSGSALWGRVFVALGLVLAVSGFGLGAAGYVWLPPNSAEAQGLGEPWAGLNAQAWEQVVGEAEEVLDGRRMPREARQWVREGVPAALVGGALGLGTWAIAFVGLAPLAFLTPLTPAARPDHRGAEPRVEPSFADALARAEIQEPETRAPASTIAEELAERHAAADPVGPAVEPAVGPEQAERVLRQLCNDIGRAQQHVLNASLDLKGLNLQDSLAQARDALERAGAIAEKLRT